MTYKKYSVIFIVTLSILIVSCIGLTWYVDPYFHYGPPNKHFDHMIYNQRYQNDGIVRNFSYDAIITGTSMTENFKSSEFDKLFNVNSIKVPFSGAFFKEVNDNLNRAIEANDDIKYVVRSLDYFCFFTDVNTKKEDVEYPSYLTNDIVWDDVSYLLNKEILFGEVLRVLKTYSHNDDGKVLTSFDKYSNWNKKMKFGKSQVLKAYSRDQTGKEFAIVKEEEVKIFEENIEKNIIDTIVKNPDIQFYYFFPPYSICFWDDLKQKNGISKYINGEEMIIESLVKYENVHLYSFNNNYDIITNLDNYTDILHYDEKINSFILEEMTKDTYRLTNSNYHNYLTKLNSFYSNYDYEQIFK